VIAAAGSYANRGIALEGALPTLYPSLNARFAQRRRRVAGLI
jgi:hypothetical protein